MITLPEFTGKEPDAERLGPPAFPTSVSNVADRRGDEPEEGFLGELSIRHFFYMEYKQK